MLVTDVDKEEILRAIQDLRNEQYRSNNELWSAITKLKEQINVGQGAVKALMWIGGVGLAIAGIFASLYHTLGLPK